MTLKRKPHDDTFFFFRKLLKNGHVPADARTVALITIFPSSRAIRLPSFSTRQASAGLSELGLIGHVQCKLPSMTKREALNVLQHIIFFPEANIHTQQHAILWTGNTAILKLHPVMRQTIGP